MTRRDLTPVVTEDDREAYLRRVGHSPASQKYTPEPDDPEYQHEEPNRPTGLAVLSALLLVAIVGVPVLAMAALRSMPPHDPVDPTALFLFVLWLPASFIAWVAVTVRALHRLDLKFWEMRATWIAAACCVAGIFIGFLWFVFWRVDAPLVHVVSAGLLVGLVGWVFVLDYRATRSVLLAVSVTALQVVAGFGVIFAIHRLLEVLEGDDDRA